MTSRLLIVLALVMLNAFFVAAEFALVRSRRNRLEAMVRAGDAKARVALRAIANLGTMLSASQLGITLASLGLGWVAERTVAALLRDLFVQAPAAVGLSVRLAAAVTVALLVITYLHVVFGELAPRAAALANPERIARWLAPPLIAFAWVATPFIYILNRSSQGLLRVTGRPPNPSGDGVQSAEELRMLIEQSEESGMLMARDAKLIEGVFEFSEKTAREVMTPRTEIVGLPIASTLGETLAFVEDGGFSRYPVYEDSIDDIVGVVLAKDLLRVLRHHIGAEAGRPPFSLLEVVRPVHVIPGSREVEDVLADFKRLKEHLAIVLDEHGGTAGLVTMDDLLGEIVGEILDEYDEPAFADALATPTEVRVPGSTHVGELNDRFGLSVPDDEHTTIGGVIFGVLGRLPVVGDRVTTGGAVFIIASMAGRRIDTVAIDLHTAGDRRGELRDG